MANFTRIGYGQVEPNQLSGIKTGQIYASLPLDKNVQVLQQGEFMFYNYGQQMVTADPATVKDGSNKMTEPYMVYQEIKIYEDWLTYKDFAMIRVGDNYVTNRPAVGTLTSIPIDQKTGEAADVYGDGSKTVGVVPSVIYGPEGDKKTKVGHTEYGYRMDGIAPRMLKTNIGDIYTTNMVEVGTEDNPIEYAVGEILKPKKTVRNTLELSKTGDIDGVQFVVAKVYTMPDGQPGLKLQRIA